MPKLTLLEVTQSVLNAMDSDVVTAITDTEESKQIALVAKEVYYDLITDDEWHFQFERSPVTSAAGPNRPSAILLDDEVEEVTFLEYDVSNDPANPQCRPIPILPISEFMCKVKARDASSPDVVLHDTDDGLCLKIATDKQPNFATSINDDMIIFDSYDITIDASGIDTDKVSVLAYVIPAWTHDGSFTPDLPSKFFPLYLAEVKNVCFNYYQGEESPTDSAKGFKQRNRKRRNEGSRTGNNGRNPSRVGYGRR